MAEEIEKETGIVFESRRELKDEIFAILYPDNRFIGQKEAIYKRIFKRLFPGVYEVFRLIKMHHRHNLPILFQQLESKLMLEIVAKRICKEYPDIPIFTIHDSIVCPVGMEQYVASIIDIETQKCIGVKPRLEFEYWKPVSDVTTLS
jgi:hypothetical protein